MKYRDIIRAIEANGWRLERTVGSYMQYRHPTKPGTVTVSGGGKLSRDVPTGTLNSILKQAGLKWLFMDYVVVIERASDGGYWAYVPDLPGCTRLW